MPPDEATELAEASFGSFVGVGSRYFTNGEFGKPRSHPDFGPGWSPATEHTFDTGVLVLTSRQVGCAWFLDVD